MLKGARIRAQVGHERAKNTTRYCVEVSQSQIGMKPKDFYVLTFFEVEIYHHHQTKNVYKT